VPTTRPVGVRWPTRPVPAIRSAPPGLVAAISAGPTLCSVRPIAAAAFAGAAAAPVGACAVRACAVRVAASALAAGTALITALATGIPVTARSTATRGTFSAVTGTAVPRRRSAVSAGGTAAG
jgi:hypothetical protein